MRCHLPLVLLAALGAAACDRDPSGPPQRNLSLGQQLTLNVSAGQGDEDVCEQVDNREVRVVALSEHAAVLEQVGNPPGSFTEAEYQTFIDEFERVIWPVDTENFGEPSDIDRNGRVMIVFTRAVNELTERGSGSVVGGFFFSRDLFPEERFGRLQGCKSSNQGEVFFLLAPDPNGVVNNNPRSKEYVRGSSFSTLAHEFQHLINSSRRLFVNEAPDLEETWLDEGLSHIAEELAFYRASGLGPRQNIALTTTFFPSGTPRFQAFQRYQDQNFGRIADYYRNVDENSPIQGTEDQVDDDLGTRGSAWQFLRYAADQRGGDERAFWFALANSRETGLKNLAAVLGSDPTPVFQNWGISVYTDDSGIPNLPATYQQPSWNFRQILGTGTGGFRLETIGLTNGTRNVDIPAHGQAYLRFGLGSGTRAEIRTSAQNTPAAGSCTEVNLAAAGQVFQGTPANASVLCVSGPPGAEYVLIPFYGSTANNARAPISVTATGVGPVSGAPSPVRAAAGPTLRAAALLEGDDWEVGHRARERRLAARLAGGGGASRNVLADPAAPELRLTLIRTR